MLFHILTAIALVYTSVLPFTDSETSSGDIGSETSAVVCGTSTADPDVCYCPTGTQLVITSSVSNSPAALYWSSSKTNLYTSYDRYYTSLGMKTAYTGLHGQLFVSLRWAGSPPGQPITGGWFTGNCSAVFAPPESTVRSGDPEGLLE